MEPVKHIKSYSIKIQNLSRLKHFSMINEMKHEKKLEREREGGGRKERGCERQGKRNIREWLNPNSSTWTPYFSLNITAALGARIWNSSDTLSTVFHQNWQVSGSLYPILQASYNLYHSLKRCVFSEVAWTQSGWFKCRHTQEVVHLMLTSRGKHIQGFCLQPLQTHLPLQWSM